MLRRPPSVVILLLYAMLVVAQYVVVALPGPGHLGGGRVEMVIDAILIAALATLTESRVMWRVVWWISLLRQAGSVLLALILLSSGTSSAEDAVELPLAVFAVATLVALWRPRLSEVA